MRVLKIFYVYIIASKRNGTLYVGVTRNLLKRISEHKSNLIDGFTKKYCVHKLVYYEDTDYFQAAVTREKQIKKWNRKWKLELIEKFNPEWKYLFYEIGGSDFKDQDN